MVPVEDDADIEAVEFFIADIRKQTAKAIRNAIMAAPELSLQTKLIVMKIVVGSERWQLELRQ